MKDKKRDRETDTESKRDRHTDTERHTERDLQVFCQAKGSGTQLSLLGFHSLIFYVFTALIKGLESLCLLSPSVLKPFTAM